MTSKLNVPAVTKFSRSIAVTYCDDVRLEMHNKMSFDDAEVIGGATLAYKRRARRMTSKRRAFVADRRQITNAATA